MRFLAVILVAISAIPSFARADLKRYDGKYYTVYTDLDAESAREAVLRMTRMAEEYHARTAGFSGQITTRFPFYLYTSSADYLAAGGLPDTSGVFITDGTGGRLMAVAGRHPNDQTWHSVQHEGFHQFAHAVIGGKLPAWLDEGLAEYFGESIFTGDGFVTGVVPPWRLARLKREIGDGSLKSVDAIMAVSSDQWRSEMSLGNYDQAWSMVHYLVHADGGKYREPFGACIRDVSAGKPFATCWSDRIGASDAFQQRWSDYWKSQPHSPTSVLYAEAACASLTSFLGRATAKHQTFADYPAFQAAAESGGLKTADNDWLPPSLLREMSRLARNYDGWSLAGRPPVLVLALPDGTRLTGSFVLSNLKVEKVTVDVDDVVPVLAAAKKLAVAGKKDEARDTVTATLKEHPKSPAAADARKFLAALRGS